MPLADDLYDEYLDELKRAGLILWHESKFSEFRKEVEARRGAKGRVAAKRAETLLETRLYELCHAEAVSQAEPAGRLDVTQGAISKLEHSEDVRVSTLRQCIEALGARLELVAVFEDEGRPYRESREGLRCVTHVVDALSVRVR